MSRTRGPQAWATSPTCIIILRAARTTNSQFGAWEQAAATVVLGGEAHNVLVSQAEHFEIPPVGGS